MFHPAFSIVSTNACCSDHLDLQPRFVGIYHTSIVCFAFAWSLLFSIAVYIPFSIGLSDKKQDMLVNSLLTASAFLVSSTIAWNKGTEISTLCK
jgi:hypothetical protein